MSAHASVGLSKIFAVIGLVFWVFYVLRYVLGLPLFLTSEQGPNLFAQIAFMSYGYMTLLVGVFLGVVYKEIKGKKSKGRTRIKIGGVMRDALQSPDFWMAIFASPVVYIILLQAVDLENISLTGSIALTLVGLQNGFVCNTVAETIMNKKDEQSGE